MTHARFHPRHAGLGTFALGIAWSIVASRSRQPAALLAGACAANRPFKRVFAAF